MTIFSLSTFSYSPPPPSPLLHTLGARVGVRPPLGAVLQIFPHVGALLLRFSPYGELILPCGGLFDTFFSLCGTYFTMWGPFWYIFLLMGNFFYHVGVFFLHVGAFDYVFILIGTFFYHVGRQSYHVGDFLLRFSFYWELVLPCGGIFATFFSIWGVFFVHIWGAFLYIWGAFFVHMGGPFLYIWGHFGLPPPRTNIPARPRVPIAIPHHIIMPAITV